MSARKTKKIMMGAILSVVVIAAVTLFIFRGNSTKSIEIVFED